MATEAEAVRKGSEEERQRIAGRCAALDREKRKADSAARAEIDRLTEQVWLLHCSCIVHDISNR